MSALNIEKQCSWNSLRFLNFRKNCSSQHLDTAMDKQLIFTGEKLKFQVCMVQRINLLNFISVGVLFQFFSNQSKPLISLQLLHWMTNNRQSCKQPWIAN